MDFYSLFVDLDGRTINLPAASEFDFLILGSNGDMWFRKSIQQVCWQSYKRLNANFIPDGYERPMDFALSRTVLMCFQKCAYHMPRLSPFQFGLKENCEGIAR